MTGVRNRSILFALSVAAVSAQTSQPLSELLPPPTPGPVIIDLDGTWEAPIGDTEYVRIIVQHRGNNIWASFADTAPGTGEKLLFTGLYAGEHAFTVKVPPDRPGDLIRDLSVTVPDPDTLKTVSALHSRTFVRISKPTLHDIPCDPQNSLHVTAAGALARAWVGAYAHDGPSTFCWVSLAASMGDPEAEYQKGSCFLTGFGAPKDPQAAFHWIELSARHKYLTGIKATADMLERGEGTPRNPEMAGRWRLMAENQQLEDVLGVHTEQDRQDLARRVLNGLAAPDPVYVFHCIDGAVVELPKSQTVPSGYDVCEHSHHGGYLRP